MRPRTSSSPRRRTKPERARVLLPATLIMIPAMTCTLPEATPRLIAVAAPNSSDTVSDSTPFELIATFAYPPPPKIV